MISYSHNNLSSNSLSKVVAVCNAMALILTVASFVCSLIIFFKIQGMATIDGLVYDPHNPETPTNPLVTLYLYPSFFVVFAIATAPFKRFAPIVHSAGLLSGLFFYTIFVDIENSVLNHGAIVAFTPYLISFFLYMIFFLSAIIFLPNSNQSTIFSCR